MCDYQIEFDDKIHWNESYKRNCKNKNSKHVLCFPNCDIKGHRVYFHLFMCIVF